MNVDILAPGTKVFYLRGTTGERVAATVVGLSSFPECVAISYERSGHTQLYKDCPPSPLSARSPPLGNVVLFNNEGGKPLENKALETKHFETA